MLQKRFVLNEKRNVSLTAYLLDVGGEFRFVPKRPAVLVIPGGGYQMCSDREADPVALAYLRAGYHAFVLRYTVGPDTVWPRPLEDYEQAMTMLRENAEEWNLYPDKIAVIGFSAGGHLAAAAATMAKNRPNAAILGYAVAGEDVRECCATAPDTIAAVDKDTCPCFLFATRTDTLVPIDNTIRFMQALDKSGVSFESHIYAFGPHGFSVCSSDVQDLSLMCDRAPNWVADSVGWLRDVLGDFGPAGMTAPRCKAHANADHEPMLSVDCTFGHLMKNEAAKRLITSLMGGAELPEEHLAAVRRMPLREMLSYTKPSQEEIEAVDRQLSQIPNLA